MKMFWKIFAKASFFTITILVVGCGRSSGLSMSTQEFSNLNRILSASPTKFYLSHVELDALGQSTIKVQVDGTVSRDPEDSTGFDAWIPLALVTHLPDYIGDPMIDDSLVGEIESYQLRDNLWLIGVSLQDTSPVSTVTDSTSIVGEQVLQSDLDRKVKLSVIMSSQLFESSFALAIPVGETRRVVEIAVGLPKGSSLDASEVFTNRTADSRPVQLALLPPVLSPNAVRAAARSQAPTGAVWDFSKISFTKSHTGISVKAVGIGIAATIMLLMIFYQSLKYRMLASSRASVDSYRVSIRDPRVLKRIDTRIESIQQSINTICKVVDAMFSNHALPFPTISKLPPSPTIPLLIQEFQSYEERLREHQREISRTIEFDPGMLRDLLAELEYAVESALRRANRDEVTIDPLQGDMEILIEHIDRLGFLVRDLRAILIPPLHARPQQ